MLFLYLHCTMESYHFLKFLLINAFMNVCFAHKCQFCIKQRKEKNVLSTYGVQGNSSEKMLTSRWVSSYLLSVLFGEKYWMYNMSVLKEKKCLSLHLAPWQTTALPRAVLRKKVEGEWKKERWGGVKGEKELLGWSGEGKKKWEKKVDGKSTDVEECIHVSQVKAELWYDQPVYM